MPTDQEFAYAAGLFDGEGTIDVQGRVRMAVKMTDKEPIDALVDILGGHFYQWKNQKSGRPTFEWRASGWEGTMDAIDSIMPYSTGKHKQLEVVAGYYDYREAFGQHPDAQAQAAFQLRRLRDPVVVPLTFDIETMGFESDTLPLLSCSFQWGDDEAGIFSLRKETPASDRDLAVGIRDVIESAPFSIGWNSLRFDINYINTRLLLHGERPLFAGCHISADVVYDRQRGRRKRTSLHDAANELGVADDKTHKTPIDWAIWNAANVGDIEAMDYVVNHGKNDIALTKRVYNAIT